MPVTYCNAFCTGRNQGTGYSQFLFIAEQSIRIIGLECQSQDCRNRTQGDIAFFPVQAHTEHLFTLELTFTDDTGIRNRARIGTCTGSSQRKAGNLLPGRQKREIMILL